MGCRNWRRRGATGEAADAKLAQLLHEQGFDMNNQAIVNTIGARRFARPTVDEGAADFEACRQLAALQRERAEYELNRRGFNHSASIASLTGNVH